MQIFYNMSLLKQCCTLHHHSLESFIMEQVEADQAYRLLEIEEHPKLGTISAKVLELWQIFCTETYATLKSGTRATVPLTERQIRSLKKLSVLSALEGKTCIAISTLCKELDADKLSLFRLLMEMNSKNLISVKIDDRSNKCLVLGCKRRLTKRETLKAECQARLEKILQANNQLIQSLSKHLSD